MTRTKKRHLLNLMLAQVNEQLIYITAELTAHRRIGRITDTAYTNWTAQLAKLEHLRREMQANLGVLVTGMLNIQLSRHIVQYSGGICSFFAAQRVVEKFGKDVVLLFADTKMEDEDLYRFLDDTSKFLGVPVTKIADGRNPWEVFKDERFLGNSRVDPCSKILKREFIDRWIAENAAPDAIRYFGLDWTETDRFERLRARFAADGVPNERIQAPMLWKPIVDKPDMLKRLVKLGIKVPNLYTLGYQHNNCGGFCVKSGQAQFRLLLVTMPERYAWHEAREEELRQYLKKDVSILRDRRGGKSTPLTLRAFRERIQGGGEHDRHDWGGCGCGVE